MDSKLKREPHDTDIRPLKAQVDWLKGSLITGVVDNNEIVKHCKLWNEKFGNNCDLENHMIMEHNAPKEFAFDMCTVESLKSGQFERQLFSVNFYHF